MTVCIAAICDGNFIIGLSDRMLTAGDIQYEPPVPKVLPLTSSIVAMSSGDAAFQREVLFELSREISAQIEASPQEWLNVSDVVWMYIRHRAEARLKRSEAALLSPLGLDRHTYLHLQQSMSPGLVEQISRDLINFQVPSTSCIIAGVDLTGAHIYTVYDGQVACSDAVGFACIGSGATHASSQFMLAQHGPNQSSTGTLLVAYNAKRRSEVAPGVGAETDMFVVGPRVGTYAPVEPSLTDALKTQYENLILAERQAADEARRGIAAHLEQLIARTPADQETGGLSAAELDGGSTSSEPFG